MENIAIFSTRDLYLAATLVTLKFEMVGVDYVIDGQKNLPIGFFKFLDTPELGSMRSKFTQGILLVEPKAFVTNLKSLKSEIVNSTQNPHSLNKKNFY